MKDLTVGNERNLILKFAMPMLLANLFQQTYTIADLAIIGNSHIGDLGITAITNSFHIIFSLIALIIGISVGFNVIISQYFGAKQIEKVKLTVDTMVVTLVFASLAITLVGLIISEPLFVLIKVPVEAMPMATSYINVYFLGVIAFFGFHGVSAVLRGLGDSKTPLYFMIASSILNIILDYYFIIVLEWGIEWAAIATIIAQGIVFILAVIYLNKTHKIVNFSFTRFRFDKNIFEKCIAIGLPSGIQTTLVGLSMLALMWIINPFGNNTVAAFGIASRIDQFASLPAMNFAMALSTFVGQNLGARKIARVRNGFHSTLIMNSIITIIVTILVVFGGRQLMSWFTDSPEVIEIGVKYLVIVSSFYIVFTSMFIIGGVLRGAGDTVIPMFITLFALWAVRIPLAWALSETKMGINGVWWAIPIAWFLGMFLSFLYYKTGRWKKKSVIDF
ncbi:MAG: MATE family efflux transporter [Bacteroidales bacterium]|nr:MATE family efflux transporter [Bacteroidales bacterium]